MRHSIPNGHCGSGVIPALADPLYLFLLAGMGSPGPNVILLSTFGARFGFRPVLPHLFGVVAGVGIIGAAAGLGIASFLAAAPELRTAARIGAALWILWMAYALHRSVRAAEAGGALRPFTFVEAVLFQWVNPKVWAVALAASAGFPGGLPPVAEAVRLALAFVGVNLLVCLAWTSAGTVLGRLLDTPVAWRRFMNVMAILLAASASMVFL